MQPQYRQQSQGSDTAKCTLSLSAVCQGCQECSRDPVQLCLSSQCFLGFYFCNLKLCKQQRMQNFPQFVSYLFDMIKLMIGCALAKMARCSSVCSMFIFIWMHFFLTLHMIFLERGRGGRERESALVSADTAKLTLYCWFFSASLAGITGVPLPHTHSSLPKYPYSYFTLFLCVLLWRHISCSLFNFV